jgi:hypothetical protein
VGHRRTGVVAYLDATPGHEGEAIAVRANELATTVERSIDEMGLCTIVLWLNDDTDVLCSTERVHSWGCTQFTFDFDGLAPDEAREAAAILFDAQRRATDRTALWLVDFVGVGRERRGVAK